MGVAIMTTYRTATTPSDAMLVLTNIGAEPVSFPAYRPVLNTAPEEARVVSFPRRDLPFRLS